MESLIGEFDTDLLSLANRRRRLAVELKYAQLFSLELYQQLKIIRSCQEEDDRLLARVKKLQGILQAMDEKVKMKLYPVDPFCIAEKL